MNDKIKGEFIMIDKESRWRKEVGDSNIDRRIKMA